MCRTLSGLDKHLLREYLQKHRPGDPPDRKNKKKYEEP